MPRYQIKVIPKSSRNQVEERGTFELRVKLMAPPVDGKANDALREVLADYFKVKKSEVRILKGLNSPHKLVEIP